MRNIQFWRLLRDDDFQAIVAIPKQFVVAKDGTWTKLRSYKPKLWKGWYQRGMKGRAGQRLEINIQAAPSVPLPPLPNWITLHSHPPLAAESGVDRSPAGSTYGGFTQHGTFS
jgi:hypothetical protein